MSELMKKLNKMKKETENNYTLGKVNYNDILWIKSQLNDLSQSANPFKRLMAKFYMKKLLNIVKSMKTKDNIKPQSLLDFAEFYVATHGLVDCDYINGTTSRVLVSTGINTDISKMYFSIKVRISMHKKISTWVCFKTIPSEDPNMVVETLYREPDGDRGMSCTRMFLSLDENDGYRVAWELMCDYIKMVILS